MSSELKSATNPACQSSNPYTEQHSLQVVGKGPWSFCLSAKGRHVPRARMQLTNSLGRPDFILCKSRMNFLDLEKSQCFNFLIKVRLCYGFHLICTVPNYKQWNHTIFCCMYPSFTSFKIFHCTYFVYIYTCIYTLQCKKTENNLRRAGSLLLPCGSREVISSSQTWHQVPSHSELDLLLGFLSRKFTLCLSFLCQNSNIFFLFLNGLIQFSFKYRLDLMTLIDTISNLGELSISMRMLNGYLKINKAQTKFFFWGSYSPDWPQIYYAAQTDLEFISFCL